MFNLKLSNPVEFYNTIKIINSVVDEADIEISPDSIHLRAMDPARVALVDFLMKKTAFDEYTCEEEQKFCLNLEELLKYLKRAGKDEIIALDYDSKNTKLKITITGKYSRSFSMPTLDPSDDETPIPKVTFKASAKLATKPLKRALEDAALVSDHIKISLDKDKMLMKAKGDISSADAEFKNGSDSLLETSVQEDSVSTYSLTYLAEFLKLSLHISDLVVLSMTTDMPIKLDFEQKEGHLLFFLAPRIEVD